jgi:hypothetical protein
MKMGVLCHHLLKRMLRREQKRRNVCVFLLHIAILTAQTVAFVQFCRRKGVKLCLPKWKKRCACLCDGEDANRSDTAGVSDASRPEESEGIVTAEGKIGDVEQTVSKKRATPAQG